MKISGVVTSAAVVLLLVASTGAQSKFALEIYTGRGQVGYEVNSTMIAALKPAVVIPGHEGPGATRDMRAIDFMKQYIADWDANVARSKTAAEMRAHVLKQYHELGMEFTLNDRIATYFPAQPPGSK